MVGGRRIEIHDTDLERGFWRPVQFKVVNACQFLLQAKLILCKHAPEFLQPEAESYGLPHFHTLL